MNIERIGWSFDGTKERNFRPPQDATLEVVGLLIRHKPGPNSQMDADNSHGIYIWLNRLGATILDGKATPRDTSWPSRAATAEQSFEDKTMPTNARSENRDVQLEERLEAILKTPELAAEAFPDDSIRQNVVPLLRGVRQKAADVEKNKNP